MVRHLIYFSNLLRSSHSRLILVFVVCVGLIGCNQHPPLPTATIYPSQTKNVDDYTYLIGPLDGIRVFVWGNPEVGGGYTVRPDGKITTNLVEDIPVSGRTSTQFAREIEKILSTYIRDPIVTVTVTSFGGPFSEQVRIIGEAKNPQAIPYTEEMTLLDLMIKAGGLTEFAGGNQATLARIEDGQYKEYKLSIESLINDGNISANVDILPGDIIIIPEAWF